MHTRRLTRRPARLLAAALVLGASVTGLGAGQAIAADAVPASGCQSLIASQPLNPDTANVLQGVTVVSPCNAWAVGFSRSGGGNQTLMEHWNGSSWRVFLSSSPGTADNELLGVHARSGSDIWAVGAYSSAPVSFKTLVLHWNGRTWTRLPSPTPGTEAVLTAVHATSGTDAWAVGHTFTGTHASALLLHWNGHTWQQAKNPIPKTPAELLGVTATSARNAWAVGYSEKGSSQPSLILHWNGRSWSRVASPSPGGENTLTAVAASSARNAWAVGVTLGQEGRTFILHWNGRFWTRTRSPNIGGPAVLNSLQGVTVLSGSNAWAVGYSGSTQSTQQPVILHWNGHAWQLTPAPDPGGGSELRAVAARSGGDLWAVGFTGGIMPETLAVHCC